MLSDALSYMNTTFTLFFTIECVLKLTTFGRVKFLRRRCPPCPQCENLIKFNELLATPKYNFIRLTPLMISIGY